MVGKEKLELVERKTGDEGGGKKKDTFWSKIKLHLRACIRLDWEKSVFCCEIRLDKRTDYGRHLPPSPARGSRLRRSPLIDRARFNRISQQKTDCELAV